MTIKIPNCCPPLTYIYRVGNLKTLLDTKVIITPGNIKLINKKNRIKNDLKNKHIQYIIDIDILFSARIQTTTFWRLQYPSTRSSRHCNFWTGGLGHRHTSRRQFGHPQICIIII